MSQPYDDKMTAAMPLQGTPAMIANAGILPLRSALKFVIEIPAADGTMLVRMTEDEHGRLVITGDESRWDEGAKRFLYAMMQWSGLVGLRWKDEAKKAAE